jgi:predicted N-acetyltransferase YhbS
LNLKREYAVTGVDLSPRMLELARELNPECDFVQGDMREFDLGRTFDAVLMDDAISYMTTRSELRSAFAAAWRHLAPGGVMVVTPDETRESFVQNRTEATPATGAKPAGVDVVFVENSYDPDLGDDHYEATMVYLIREDGRLRVETDRHLLGLFPLAAWRETLTGVGFRIHEAAYEEGGRAYVSFACLKPREREMEEELRIRPERTADIDAIADVTEQAFRSHPYSRRTEQFVIAALRRSGALALSLVAEIDGRIVGHIAFSPVRISDGSPEWYALGPVSVTPAFQHRGIGQSLVKAGMLELRGLGAAGCVLVGEPGFYGRFGFRSHPGLGMEGVPGQYVLSLPLGGHPQAQGTITHHEAFDARGPQA